MNRISLVAFAVALAMCASARAADAYVVSTPPVQGCMNQWLSNGVWGIRVTQIQVSPDRVDVSVVVRNDTAKAWQPNTDAKPFGSPNLAGLSLGYPGDYAFTIVDYTGNMSYDASHPRDTHDDDPMMHRLTPGATYKTVLVFYFPQSSGFPPALEKQRPKEFWLYDDEVFRHMEWGGNAIEIKLNCSK
jgi:hypothetical protein